MLDWQSGPEVTEYDQVRSLDIARGSDQASIWISEWLPPRWWWPPQKWARELMRQTQRLRRELVARGVSKREARRLVPRIPLHRPEEP